MINLAFDDRDASPRAVFERHYRTTHYQRVVESGAVRIARSSAELVDLVNASFADPGRDAEGRRRLVASHCEFTDGCSATRVGREIVRALTAAPAPAARG